MSTRPAAAPARTCAKAAASAAASASGPGAAVGATGVADAAAWEVGLPCGGEIAVMVQPVSAAGFDPELFDRIADARDAENRPRAGRAGRHHIGHVLRVAAAAGVRR